MRRIHSFFQYGHFIAAEAVMTIKIMQIDLQQFVTGYIPRNGNMWCEVATTVAESTAYPAMQAADSVAVDRL